MLFFLPHLDLRGTSDSISSHCTILSDMRYAPQSLAEAEERMAASEAAAGGREAELQAALSALRAEAKAREESAAAAEARLQEALDAAAAAAVDRHRLEAKLQEQAEVHSPAKNIRNLIVATYRLWAMIEYIRHVLKCSNAMP